MSKKILLVAGPSGSGKSTLIGKLTEEFPGKFGFSISHTTRPIRGAEKHGVEYYFTTVVDMEKEIQEGKFVEHALVHGNYYGTSIMSVKNVQEMGQICLLDVDVQGVESITKCEQFECVNVFIKPPAFDILIGRLTKRGDTSEQGIKTRMETAKKELALLESNPELFNFTFVNDDLEEAYGKFRKFVMSEFDLKA